MALRNYFYFCAKLHKKVETAKFIIGVLVFLIPAISELKKYFDKKKAQQAAVRDFTPLPVERPSASATSKPKPVAKVKKIHNVVKPASPVSTATLPEEGERVTADTTIESIAAISDPNMSDRQKDDLRDRIIWGEILARKF